MRYVYLVKIDGSAARRIVGKYLNQPENLQHVESFAEMLPEERFATVLERYLETSGGDYANRAIVTVDYRRTTK